MSGPKVVRVVTREERLVECLAALARLDNAIRAAAAQDADGTATAALRERRETLAALLDGTVLDGVAQRLAAEAAFVRDTVEQRRIAAAEAKAAALRQARQQRANAEILLRELAAKGGGDATIADALQRVRSGQCDGSDAERIVREAAAKLVVAAPEPALGDVQREIAKRLRANEALADYVIWQVPADPRERRLQRIEQRLAQLSVLLGDALADAFAARLRSLESAPDDARGHLLADSLIADLQAAVDQARQTAALVAAAEDLLAGIESAAATDGAQDIAAQAAALRAAIAGQDAERLRDAVSSAEAAWKACRAQQAAQARRAAILTGLATLGYEVHEGMNTALAAQGRVVLKNPALAGFGVEIAGAADAARLQVRAVAFDPARDSRRDRDAETLWCADFHQLEEMLAQQGSGVVVEKALAIGAAPLKVVEKTETSAPAPAAVRQK